MNKLTLKEVKSRLKVVSATKILSRQYRNARTPLKCKCSCGHIWKVKWDFLIRRRGICPRCSMENSINGTRFTLEKVKSELERINPQIKILAKKYVNSFSNLECMCIECGHTWSPTWTSLQRGKGCPNCRGGVRLSTDEIKKRLREISPTIKIISKYENNLTPMKCKCSVCGHSWKSNWKSLSEGIGCSRCHPCKFEISEVEARQILEQLTGFKFPKAKPSEVPWLHGLHLDGYCPDLKSGKFPNGVAFERQGEQHYRLTSIGGRKDSVAAFRKRKRNDWRKRVQCWRHGVKLISIPYWIKNVESYFAKRLESFL